MAGELSHNLAPLITSGNRILRSDTNVEVLLRGVNRSGLEYTETGGISEEEIREIVVGWGANVLRLPFNQDWALRSDQYLASINEVISSAAQWGAYTILDLQWLDAETIFGYTPGPNGEQTPNHVAPAPDENTVLLWNKLATRYRDEPAVLFDLFNEPHSPITADGWSAWAARLVQEIRGAGAPGLVLVGGIDWAFDLRDVQVDGANIVYSAHIYANRKSGDWHKALSRSADVPVFVGEWGGTDDQLAFGRDLAARMRKERLGWTAWSWVDYPQLIQPPRSPNYLPTAFGQLVKDELAAPAASST
jgi:endoglucanase